MCSVTVCHSSVGRTLEEFKTSVMVAASSKVTFELTYEELLIRRLGKYQLLINVQPMQPVADFKVKAENRLNGQFFCTALLCLTPFNKHWIKILLFGLKIFFFIYVFLNLFLH